MENQFQLVNPFSDKFLETWGLWKMFRKEYDKFWYKGVISEQMALKKLVELSDGEEEKAVKIVEQSISREWTGFYPLKQSSNGKSGKKSAKTGTDTKPDDSLRERVIKAANDRYNKGGASGDQSHLKVV